MNIIESIEEMQALSRDMRDAGKTISFVPTMGYLHEGHGSLLREGRKRGDCLVVSIYVNPTQFGAGEDFERYPRDWDRDREIAQNAGVDIIFTPLNSDMYPAGYQTFIDVTDVTENLCGRIRTGHFRGVATICCKLFHIVRPHVAIFGKKDFQQLAVIQRMVKDLNMDIEVLGMPTVRERDGLAMSSRNVYLQGKERESALSLIRSLMLGKQMFESGERNSAEILKAVTDILKDDQAIYLEYAKICDVDTLKDLTHIDRQAVFALAARIGSTRLIDNYVFGDQLTIS